jgi:hypothetical protein
MRKGTKMSKSLLLLIRTLSLMKMNANPSTSIGGKYESVSPSENCLAIPYSHSWRKHDCGYV